MDNLSEKKSLNHFLLVPHGIKLYSGKIGCSNIDAYDATSIIFKNILKWIFVDYNIKEFSFIGLTLNAMQTRSAEELTPIMEVESTTYEDPDLVSFLMENQIKVTFKGNFSKLPKYYRRAMKNITKLTENHMAHKLNILVGYGLGKKSLFSKIKKKLFRDIFTSDPPDLMVSTAGRDFSIILEKIPKTTKTLVVDTIFPELTQQNIKSFVDYYFATP